MLIRRDWMTPDGMLLSAEEAQSWAWTFCVHLTYHPSLDLGAAPERRCRRPTLAGHPGDGWDPAACTRGPSPSFLGVAVHEAKVTSAEKSIAALARLAEPLKSRSSEPQRAALAPRSVTRSSPRMSPDAAEVLNADDSPRPDLTP